MGVASTATEATRSAVSDELVAEQDRARQMAAARRGRRRLYVLAIRAVSLAVVLTAWQLVGQRIDPILFTTPSAVSVAALQMVASGELWSYLWPSLVVLVVGLAVSAVAGTMVGLLLARLLGVGGALAMFLPFPCSPPPRALG